MSLSLRNMSLVRTDRGLTQAALARQLGWSQGHLSKVEDGLTGVSPDQLVNVADALYCSPELLTVDVSEITSSRCIHHRKRKRIPAKTLRPIDAGLTLSHLIADRLIAVSDRTQFEVKPRRPDGGLYEPEDIAAEVRADLGYSLDEPVCRLVEAIESHGGVVTEATLGTNKIDAMASIGRSGASLLVLLNSTAPGARQNFSLAHELAHAVMHVENNGSDSTETEADRFASSFLLPAQPLRGRLKRLDPKRIRAIAEEWQVSPQALIRRARDIGEISESKYKSLVIELGKAGYRSDEATAVDLGRASRVGTAVSYLKSQGWGIRQIEAQALCTSAELEERFGITV